MGIGKPLLWVGLGILAGCMQEDIGSRQHAPVPTPPRWDVVAYRGGTCACPNAKQYFLVNKGDKPASIALVEYKNYIAEPRQKSTARKFEDVLPGDSGRKFLQCSPDNTTTHVCGVEYQWLVDGNIFNRDRIIPVTLLEAGHSLHTGLANAMARTGLAGTARADLLRLRSMTEGTAEATAGTSCVDACREGSAQCLRVSLGNAGSDPTVRMVSLIRARGEQGYIPVETLLDALGQKGNPCERTGLSVSHGLLSNSGQACYWTGGRDTAFEVQLQIPETLAGHLGGSADAMTLTFPRPELYGPSLHFASASLDQRFGGPVSRAEEVRLQESGAPAPFVVLSGPQRCVAIKAGSAGNNKEDVNNKGNVAN